MKTKEAVDELMIKYEGAIILSTCCNETTLNVRKEDLIAILSFLKGAASNSHSFNVLMDLTGVDYLEPEAGTEIVYWLHNSSNLERIRITVFIKREEIISSVTSIWKGADWYERELYDLFGVKFEGHPEIKRILMPDDWEGHPLRKDYPLTEEPVHFKHGVKPKVPSQIIQIRNRQKYCH